MVALWEEVLGVSPVGIDDDFFELGGQSLSGLQLIGRIRWRLGVGLTLADLLECRSVQALSRRLDEARDQRRQPPLSCDAAPRPPERCAAPKEEMQ